MLGVLGHTSVPALKAQAGGGKVEASPAYTEKPCQKKRIIHVFATRKV